MVQQRGAVNLAPAVWRLWAAGLLRRLPEASAPSTAAPIPESKAYAELSGFFFGPPPAEHIIDITDSINARSPLAAVSAARRSLGSWPFGGRRSISQLETRRMLCPS